ncbi:MAG: pyridoxamine 5'-phosphate oxidase [Lewinellaceae bacterium]|nr:pyridoxamine 5'-phosphate oxidase [Lewinellaceae bacterium]
MPNIDIAALRRSYSLESLSKNDVDPNPFTQFDRWFEEALNSALPEPNAMTLATADSKGQPTARTVLLKGFDDNGFVFYTNYESQKGEDIAENPQVSLLFTWLELERQIRINGLAEKVSEEESRAYFQSRPKGSQIGAWASAQSKPITSRTALEQRMRELSEEFKHEEVLPLPPFWGGYRVKPEVLEFWQGRESRLHDRIQYHRSGAGWLISRLSP